MGPEQCRYVNVWTFSARIMMALSNGNICRVTGPLWTGEFPSQRPVTRSFDVFFDLRLNKRLSKQSWDWWFETPSWSSWRHRNDKIHIIVRMGILKKLLNPLNLHLCLCVRVCLCIDEKFSPVWYSDVHFTNTIFLCFCISVFDTLSICHRSHGRFISILKVQNNCRLNLSTL